uniref:Sulfotransferase domain-containing protein n=1 Tax=Heterosigma akashiwo TaxID=2829 RepID=A0A6V3BMT7_HETAK|mmetsp:Transcript_12470/g.17363  ORF Transcript_12470/g.17363 Transcript_12470/m.17363 type:complete len:318 (-) Transcript_12470:528-1481(-)|eukprot:CAMPEP_0194577032 /NCGR_PEP_ID=MMETSP0292-20121207/11957_1 /TAXON_ID=39354 /ORGANISM="Heterosigma akashiwo, Strain CCMP2393" /LENGTH=317 /DNA_ID=CAMNT_0039429295 /DNA_START=23 /DNA_END=976 /DNA_ORIENTATION=+
MDASSLNIDQEAKTVQWGPADNIADIRYDLNSIRGINQCPLLEESKIEDLINTFESRPDDVFICTYVKAGTTWTQQICHLLRNGGEQGEQTYAESSPWLEAVTSPILSQWEATGHSLESIATMEGPRFFKTHANIQDLPGGVERPKVIYVCRNPKDVVVSLLNHAKDKPCFGFNGDLGKMLQFFMEGTCENGSWFKHVLDWWNASQNNDRILFLHYEQMMEDPAAAITKIAEFINIELTEELLAKVVEKSSLKSMKSNSAVTSQMAKFGITAHIRKGGAGGWRNHFTVRQSELFDLCYGELMKGTGLEMDFGDGVSM